MTTKEKIECYIHDMELPYEELEEGLWIIYESEGNYQEKLVVSYSETIVHFRLKVMNIPKKAAKHCELFKKLLEINATSLTHGAFAIEQDSIVLIDSLQLENLDFNEFQASVEAIFLGIIDTYEDLSQYIDKETVAK